MSWSTRDIPNLAGRRALVTGATSGVGFETAAALAAAGAEVVMVGRDEGRGRAALARLHGRASRELLRFEVCDLTDLSAVKRLAAQVAAGPALHILVNNAGLMAGPRRVETADGMELQFAANYLGHFALTGWLLSRLAASGAGRVVMVSSLAHMGGELDFDDLQSTRYQPMRAYGRSKAATLMFALALQRRADAAGWPITSCAAHPGFAATGLLQPEPGATDRMRDAIRLLTPVVAQSAAEGALPILYAATSQKVRPGGYYGPTGFAEMRGPPGPAKTARFVQDAAAQDALWRASEALVGFRWGTLAPESALIRA
jgi:NAD(P)-dependent dehydrogenase (short-subunit alcohol dehydrogenase family)